MTRIYTFIVFLAFLVWAYPSYGNAVQDPQAAVQELKAQIDAMKAEYEKRIKDLETRIEELQVQVLQAPEAPEAPVAPPVQSTPGSLNPAISVIGNFVGTVDDSVVLNPAGQEINDKMNLREAEIDFRTAVDPYADGVLIASIESEFPGEFETGVEEGYAIIKKLPFLSSSPGGLKLKVGRFRPEFGKINVLHTHDLPSTFRPLPIVEFLGEEGYIQNGVSANFFLPTPWDKNSSLDATLDVLDGGDIAVSPNPDARISYLGHLRWYRTFHDVNNLEVGYSFYGHPSGNGIGTANLQGVDVYYRWKPLRMGEWKSYLIGAEWMFAPDIDLTEPELALARNEDINGQGTPTGFTIFNQWQFNRRVYAGLRYDFTDLLVDSNLHAQSITPYVSYYFSEFLRFRVNYQHAWGELLEQVSPNAVIFELNWIFGAHPPEPFWVNK
jgi:hypothetical protein